MKAEVLKPGGAGIEVTIPYVAGTSNYHAYLSIADAKTLHELLGKAIAEAERWKVVYK